VTVYASIAAIANIGTEPAYSLLDRNTLHKSLMALKVPNGSFSTCLGQESGVCPTFCALLVAHMTNMLTLKLACGCHEYIRRCRNHEGGFSPNPGLESPGGYAIAFRQMAFGGGFCGRPNNCGPSGDSAVLE
jgi:protein farnesyltransferase subunit beta